jgi:hypothetical protein
MKRSAFGLLLASIPCLSAYAQSGWNVKTEPILKPPCSTQNNIQVQIVGHNSDLIRFDYPIPLQPPQPSPPGPPTPAVVGDYVSEVLDCSRVTGKENIVVIHTGPAIGKPGNNTYLYGFNSQSGHIVVAWPPGGAIGNITVDAADRAHFTIGGKPQTFCWDGADWKRGENPEMCDPDHYARLINLRTSATGPIVKRPDTYSK